ncbi:hypothetical protein BB558_000808 [Smittium angustum]|uniref:Prolyl endopeptidase n=1 Tax=Smittium angustum TaxID=133377 RepID=A0A2U1JD62_SMIAN|nr:hypothetical protein BB558_000808 [Smittium angustum]
MLISWRFKIPIKRIEKLLPISVLKTQTKENNWNFQKIHFYHRFKLLGNIENPYAPPEKQTKSIHNSERQDNYSWMEKNENIEKLSKYIHEETVFTEKMLGIYSKYGMKGRKINRIEKEMDRYRTVHGVNTQDNEMINGNILCFKETSKNGDISRTLYLKSIDTKKEIILYNDREIYNRFDSIVQGYMLSNDCKYIAIQIVNKNHISDSECTDLLIFEILNDNDYKVKSRINDVFRFVWGNKYQIFYSVLDDKLRSNKVMQHLVDYEKGEDLVVYTEKNPECFIDITKTKDGEYIIIHSSSLDSSELYTLPSDYVHMNVLNTSENDETIPFSPVRPRQPKVETFIDHIKGGFIILSNASNSVPDDDKESLLFDNREGQDIQNFKLYKTKTNDPSYKNWVPWLNIDEGIDIEDVDLFKNFALVYTKDKGEYNIISVDLHTNEQKRLQLPFENKISTFIEPLSNNDFSKSVAKFSYSSPVHMSSEAIWDLNTGKIVKKNEPNPTYWDPSSYEVKRSYVSSRDGQRIPITAIFRRGTQLDKSTPLLIHSYGCYGLSLEPRFRIEDIMLLERGWGVVLIHIRGGSELGRNWYHSGRQKYKQNSINDLLDCIEYLHKNNISSPEFSAATATSAGGLVLASSVLQKCVKGEKILKSVVLQVPFLDPINALSDQNLPLSTLEIGEWGDLARDRDDFERMMEISPYELIDKLNDKGLESNETPTIDVELKMRSLPNFLLISGGKDTRVPIWHSTKWVAKLRYYLESNLVLKTKSESKNMVDQLLSSNRSTKKNSGISLNPNIYLHVDKERGHFDSNIDTHLGKNQSQSDFDPYSHKAIRNIFLLETVN